MATSGASLDACYEFKYNGKTITTVYTDADISAVSIQYENSNGPITPAAGNTYAVSKAVVTITFTGGAKVVQEVSIGNPVTI